MGLTVASLYYFGFNVELWSVKSQKKKKKNTHNDAISLCVREMFS